jgi:predicted small secreted protein
MTGRAGSFLGNKSQNIFKENMKKAFALALVAFVLAGCNTISGIGKDVQKVGQVVQGAGGK